MKIIEELKQTIINRMKIIRNSKNISLDQASELTGISKAMLSQIERGQSIPTITTLWKISTGYKVPLTYFLEEEKSSYTKIDTLNSEPVLGEDNEMRTYTLFPYNPAQNLEMLYIEFKPGCFHKSSKHMDGVEEYIFIKKGQLELDVNSEIIKLEETQCFRFKADISHSYYNSGNEICGILNIIYYPSINNITN